MILSGRFCTRILTVIALPPSPGEIQRHYMCRNSQPKDLIVAISYRLPLGCGALRGRRNSHFSYQGWSTTVLLQLRHWCLVREVLCKFWGSYKTIGIQVGNSKFFPLMSLPALLSWLTDWDMYQNIGWNFLMLLNCPPADFPTKTSSKGGRTCVVQTCAWLWGIGRRFSELKEQMESRLFSPKTSITLWTLKIHMAGWRTCWA